MSRNEKMHESDYVRAMNLLGRVREGDEVARERLASFLAEHFGFMVSTYRVRDPSVDLEDLRQTFWTAIWNALPKLDDRGNPLYHAARRGQWAVGSYIRAVNARRHGVNDEFSVQSIEATPEFEPWTEPEPELGESLIRRTEILAARAKVQRMMQHPALVDRDRDVLGWMLTNADALATRGSNKDMAAALGFTEQRASQLRSRVRRKLAA